MVTTKACFIYRCCSLLTHGIAYFITIIVLLLKFTTMKRLFLLMFLLTISVVACQRDEINVVQSSIPEVVNPYAISQEDAISYLMQTLEGDGEETRSKSNLTVESVTTIKSNDVFVSTTRSGGEDYPDDIFYVVSFGEGNGSAVLSADIRVTPVLAILDETVFTAEDFMPDTRAVGDENEDGKEELKDYLIEKIKGVAEYQINSSRIGGPVVIEPIQYTRYVTTTTTQLYIPPMLKTKWGQGSPYNVSHPNPGDVMGCVPVAIAQFLYYHRWPSSGIFNGHQYDWNLMSQTEYGASATNYSAACREVSDFMYAIGSYVGYYSNGTNVGSMVNILSLLGIPSNYQTFNLPDARDIINNRGPFGMRGQNTSADYGHAWVVDGWRIIRTVVYYNTYNQLDILIKSEVVSDVTDDRMHCNFGWGGVCDGYYSSTVLCFDTSVRLQDQYIESDYGDTPYANYSDEYIFNSAFYMVNY